MTAAKASHDYVEVVVSIESGDFFSGNKVTHRVYWKKSEQEYTTGTTDIPFGGNTIRVRSKGDDFNFQLDDEGLVVKGKTASGLTGGLGPFINYEFRFTGGPDGAYVSGCHDGYPSYAIYDNGKLVYTYKHKSLRLWKLFGKCDTQVRVSYTYPRLLH